MPPDRPVRLVVGASRGIGLELVRAQLDDPGVRRLIATHRHSSDTSALEDLRRRHGPRLLLQELDIANEASLQGFAATLADHDTDIDLAIHAAGILHEGSIQPEKSLGQCRPQNLARLFEINSIGPLMVAQAVLAQQSRQKAFTFAALSAMVGSIGDNRLGGWYGYRASKAALNQFLRTLANECRISHPGATIVAMHPGTTDTALSEPFQRNIDPGRLYTAQQTAARILAVLAGLGPEDSGGFYHWDGSQIPW